ncbi:MAG TPA: Crp/Fnr family transcriptional regulator [Macromonas sp.]|nr:Crp/Fnr family transcriptional regulator [Macromonas sp.]
MNAVLSDAMASSSFCIECVGRADCFFRQLPDAEHERIQPLLRERSFAPGDVLQRQGVLQPWLQVIKVGDLLCKSQPPVGEEHNMALIGRGQVIGLTNVWLLPSSVTVQALSAGRVCQVDIGQVRLNNLLTPEVLLLIGRRKIQAMELLANWAMVARQKTVQDRVAGVLCLLTQAQHSTQVRLPSHAVLASIVGSSREAVVRALKQLEAGGRAVRRERGLYEIEPHLCGFCAAPDGAEYRI